MGVISCKTSPHSDRDYDKFDPNKTYSLKLNPVKGSAYHFEISNESSTEVEINDKKTERESKSTVGVVFKISKDSLDQSLFDINYDKVHLYSKNGEEEVEADADNATGSLNPLDKMLGILKGANMVATVSSSGEVKHIDGYQELGDKIISTVDPAAREIVRSQWEKQIGDNLVKNNMDQLFKILPDSSVQTGKEILIRKQYKRGIVAKAIYYQWG